MKYESNILKRLIDTYGVIGNPRYLSEIIKEFIVRGKELYPHIFTYQSDWLAHIDEFGLTPDYVVSYTGQQIYAPHTKEKPVKRAILKGNTGYRDIDTGEFLETFEEGRNLELVSVKMPVLTTSNFLKVLGNEEIVNIYNSMGYSNVHAKLSENGKFILTADGIWGLPNKVWSLEPNTTYTARVQGEVSFEAFFENAISNLRYGSFDEGIYVKFTTDDTGDFGFLLTFTTNVEVDFNIFYGDVTSKITEPYKSNILTVNEDVELRGIGDVQDTLDLMTGELTQRIGEVILNGETTANGYTSVDGYIGDYADHISKLVDGKNEKLYIQGFVGNIGNSKGYILTNGFVQYKGFFAAGNNYSGLEEGLYRYTGANHAYICISASRFTEHTFEGIKKFLSENPQSYLVTNKESVVKTVGLSVKDQDNHVINQLSTFEGGTHFSTSSQEGSLLPTISVDVVTDLEETLNICSMEGNTL